MKHRRVIVSALLALSLFRCGNPTRTEQVVCGGGNVQAGRLTGSQPQARLHSNDFGPASAAHRMQGHHGKAVLRTGLGPGAIHYTIDSLRAGEHFRIWVWRHVKNPGAWLQAACPSPEAPTHEWQLRHSHPKPEGDWAIMELDITVTPEMAGLPLHILLHPRQGDSTALFDELKIEWHDHSPYQFNLREGILAHQGKRYKAVRIASRWWMAEDLQDAQGGSQFTLQQAQDALPPGWTLPSDEDWKAFEKAIGMPGHLLDQRGARGRNLTRTILSGGGTLEFSHTPEAKAKGYWTSTAASDSTQWARFIPRQTGIGRADVLKDARLYVRGVLRQSTVQPLPTASKAR